MSIIRRAQFLALQSRSGEPFISQSLARHSMSNRLLIFEHCKRREGLACKVEEKLRKTQWYQSCRARTRASQCRQQLSDYSNIRWKNCMLHKHCVLNERCGRWRCRLVEGKGEEDSASRESGFQLRNHRRDFTCAKI